MLLFTGYLQGKSRALPRLRHKAGPLRPLKSNTEKRSKKTPLIKGAVEEQLLKREEQPKEEIPFFNGGSELCQKSAFLGQILWCLRPVGRGLSVTI